MRAVYLSLPEVKADEIHTICDEPAHHLIKVVRIKLEEEILVMNGKGLVAHSKVCELGKRDLKIQILNLFIHKRRELLKLAIAVPSKEAMEDVLRQSVELGIFKITPLFTRYSENSFHFSERHQRIFESALIQSNNPYFPEVTKPQSFQEFLATLAPTESYLYFSSRQRTNTQKTLSIPCTLIIGPEGGFSEEEEKELETRVNVNFIHLPSYILRTPTAVSAAAGLVFATHRE